MKFSNLLPIAMIAIGAFLSVRGVVFAKGGIADCPHAQGCQSSACPTTGTDGSCGNYIDRETYQTWECKNSGPKSVCDYYDAERKCAWAKKCSRDEETNICSPTQVTVGNPIMGRAQHCY